MCSLLDRLKMDKDRLNQLVLMVFSDALRISEQEENYELCGQLFEKIQELKHEALPHVTLN